MASKQTKIAKCPMPGCGAVCEYTMISTGEGWDPNAEHSIDCIACGYKYAWDGGSQDEVALEIAAHNALCADIERGKQLDKMLTLFKLNPERLAFADTMQGELWIEIVVAYIRLLEGRGELAAEAIRLLKKWHTNCLCVHLYLGTRQPTGILLALPAVAKIIEEQKEGNHDT